MGIYEQKMHHFPWVACREDFVGGYMSFKQIFKGYVNFQYTHNLNMSVSFSEQHLFVEATIN